jgi:hypothetical protein
MLEEIVSENNLIVLNNNEPTYFRFGRDYNEKLDLAVANASLASKVTGFEVLLDDMMGSDHAPILVEIHTGQERVSSILPEVISPSFNFKKADWPAFAARLESVADSVPDVLNDVESLNAFISSAIVEAAAATIPQSNRLKTKRLPKSILELVKERRFVRRKMKKDPLLKTKYNLLTNQIKSAMVEFNSKSWDDFLTSLGPNAVSSRPFWHKVNTARQNSDCKRTPTLKVGEVKYVDDKSKADLFANLLETTFRGPDPSSFDQSHRKDIEEKVKSFLNGEGSEFPPVTLAEIKKQIGKTGKSSAPGLSKIHNLMLRNLPDKFLALLVRLFNLSFATSKLPVVWKSAKITMIPKAGTRSSDPSNFRPISVTCCLGKLCERVVQTRLYYFLESNNKLIMNQSGFRRFRRTADNLFFLTQKAQQAIRKGKRMCCFFFDIKKAFDNVWHGGLLNKLIEMSCPAYLVLWIADFLSGRTFIVHVGNCCSSPRPIVVGVPQGAVLSPLLFNVFINNIPLGLTFMNTESFSTLFADDLATYFIYRKDGHLERVVAKYLSRLAFWLSQNRLLMNVKKSVYTIFKASRCKKGKTEEDRPYKFPFCGENISRDPSPKFLGVVFDEHLSFNNQVSNIRAKCTSRLNILRIISHRSWKLSTKTLINVYKALVGSVIEYSAFLSSTLNEVQLKSLQAIQNKALRIIFKKPFDYPTDCLCQDSGLPLVQTRSDDLTLKYLRQARNNPMIRKLIDDYDGNYINGVGEDAQRTLLCHFRVGLN